MQSSKVRFLTADEIASSIPDHATVAITGSGGGLLEPDELFTAVERRFLQEGRPRDITLVFALGFGDRETKGINAFAHAGLVQRVIGGHWSWSPRLQDLAQGNKIAAYVLPSGTISLLLREIGARRPGLITKTGLQSFVDPRRSGGRVNEKAVEPIVELIQLDGDEYLRYLPFTVDIALVRGSEVDKRGNVTLAYEPAQLDVLALAQAARACGGRTFVQAKRKVQRIDPRLVHIPSVLVDGVALAPGQWQTYVSEYCPALSGEDVRIRPSTPEVSSPLRQIVARRAAMEVAPGDVVNIGFGMSSDIVSVLESEGRLPDVDILLEQGQIGGRPTTGDLFGMSEGPRAIVPSTTQFDLFSGGILDACFLGMGQVDTTGSVNVSELDGRLVGPGGFVDISQYAKRSVFCGSFTARGCRVATRHGSLQIEHEGSVKKFVEQVDQVTYSGELAVAAGRTALYITERAVFELTTEGLELVEVAPGVSIERDVIGQMGFTPIVREPRPMDSRCFI